jgi:hypothetical protein
MQAEAIGRRAIFVGHADRSLEIPLRRRRRVSGHTPSGTSMMGSGQVLRIWTVFRTILHAFSTRKPRIPDQHLLFVETMPFGGGGGSGIGHHHSKHGFDALTDPKSMLVSPPEAAIDTSSRPSPSRRSGTAPSATTDPKPPNRPDDGKSRPAATARPRPNHIRDRPGGGRQTLHPSLPRLYRACD